MSSLYLLCYLSIAVFLVAVLVRTIRIARLPLHLRWELYPVAHEKGKSQYGGSYLEEPEWWTKPRQSSLVGELKVMVPEILLLKGVREHNKSQWIRSFPFHFGLYLLVATTVLLLVGGIAGATGPGGFFGVLIPVLGYAGFGLAFVGATALFLRRATNPEYREYTSPLDLVNLLWFMAAAAVALLAHLTADPDFAGMRTFFAGLFTWQSFDVPALMAAEVVLLALLAAYVPLTHMSHFFTKYFMYHDIRWSDEPLTVGGKIERRIGRALELKPTWAASHIAGDGKKNWVDVATSTGLPAEEKGGEE